MQLACKLAHMKGLFTGAHTDLGPAYTDMCHVPSEPRVEVSVRHSSFLHQAAREVLSSE